MMGSKDWVPASAGMTGRERLGFEFLRGFGVAELRAEEEGDELRLAGLAAVFNSETVIGGQFREVIRPGAFRKTLKESDQVALWNHLPEVPLGRKSRGTLVLEEAEDGLRFGIRMDSRITAHRDAYLHVGRGDVQGTSFRMVVVKDDWSQEGDKLPLREVREVMCDEISPVTFPAYPQTEVDAREARAIVEARGLTREPGCVTHSGAGELALMRYRLELLELG